MKILRIISAIIMISLLAACGGGKSAGSEPAVSTVPVKAEHPLPAAPLENVSVSSLEPVTIPEEDNLAYVTFLSGEVELFRNEKWDSLEIDDIIGVEDTIRTGVESSCELQFRNDSVVIIEAKTVLKIDTILSDVEGSHIGLGLDMGSIMSKVNKLTTNEDFYVETGDAHCGVRGTRFSVAYTEAGTRLSVEEGRVAVLPPGIGRLSGAGKSAAVKTTAFSGGASVAPMQELFIARDVKRDEDKKGLEEIGKLVSSSDDLEALNRRISDFVENFTGRLDEVEEISVENAQKLSRLETLEPLPLPWKGDAVKKSVVRMALKTNVADAEIYINNDLKGLGQVAAVYSAGNPLSVVILHEGYEKTAFDLLPEEEDNVEYSVILRTREGSSSTPEPVLQQEVPSAEAPAVIKEVSLALEIRTEPKDARIYINDALVGRGFFTGKYKAGDKLNAKIERNGYFPVTRYIIVTEEESRIHKILLEQRPVLQASLPLSFAPIMGELLFEGGAVIGADSFGVVAASDLKGKKLWNISTSNSPNENSFPVYSAGVVCFSGSSELITVDLQKGSTIYQKELTPDEAHYFGRRVVPYGNYVFYPANNEIVIMDPRNGTKVRSIQIPGGTRMTPLLLKGSLFAVSQNGELIEADPKSGAYLNRIPTSAKKPVAASLTVKGDRLFIPGNEGAVACVDLAAGSVVWETVLVPGEKSSLFHDIAAGDRGLYLFSRNTLFALDPEKGSPLFTPVKGATAPPLYDSGLLFFGVEGGFLRIADAATGKKVADIDVKEEITTRPLAADGKLFAGTRGGNVLILDPSAFRPD